MPFITVQRKKTGRGFPSSEEKVTLADFKGQSELINFDQKKQQVWEMRRFEDLIKLVAYVKDI